MAEMNVRESCVAALKLQRERSSTYQQWTSQFHRALIGDITSRELQRNIQGIVLPEFQRISTALRSLQKSLIEPMEGDVTGNFTTCPPAGRHQVAAGNSDTQYAARWKLAKWIDQLQDLEREHYSVTLSLANKLVDHCAPNVIAASLSTKNDRNNEVVGGSRPQPSNGAATRASREVIPADMKSLFKQDDSEDEDQAKGEIDWRGKRSTGYPPAPPPAFKASAKPNEEAAPAPTTATLRVHDSGRCALARLIPPRYHTHLFFVVCRDGVDELGGGSDVSQPSSPASDIDEVERELLPVYAKKEGKGTLAEAAPLAFYVPSVISHRCVNWSHMVEAVVRRQDVLRAAIEDLCEELQSEISDM